MPKILALIYRVFFMLLIPPMMGFDDFAQERKALVDELKLEGITDERVLDAIKIVPRHLFVPGINGALAYGNYPLGIGYGQTISQPFIVAYMTQVLDIQRGDKILEIGTGSGYQAAVISQLCSPNGVVFTIEIVEPLALQAAQLLKDLKYNNVSVRSGDGYKGWVEEAPFDKIIITAAPESIPQMVLDQLQIGGKLVAPVGHLWETQELVLITREDETHFKTQKLLDVQFVPMVKK